ncbi:hypothetical protein ES705_43203 [subsurface metagenome]
MVRPWFREIQEHGRQLVYSRIEGLIPGGRNHTGLNIYRRIGGVSGKHCIYIPEHIQLTFYLFEFEDFLLPLFLPVSYALQCTGDFVQLFIALFNVQGFKVIYIQLDSGKRGAGIIHLEQRLYPLPGLGNHGNRNPGGNLFHLRAPGAGDFLDGDKMKHGLAQQFPGNFVCIPIQDNGNQLLHRRCKDHRLAFILSSESL